MCNLDHGFDQPGEDSASLTDSSSSEEDTEGTLVPACGKDTSQDDPSSQCKDRISATTETPLEDITPTTTTLLTCSFQRNLKVIYRESERCLSQQATAVDNGNTASGSETTDSCDTSASISPSCLDNQADPTVCLCDTDLACLHCLSAQNDREKQNAMCRVPYALQNQDMNNGSGTTTSSGSAMGSIAGKNHDCAGSSEMDIALDDSPGYTTSCHGECENHDTDSTFPWPPATKANPASVPCCHQSPIQQDNTDPESLEREERSGPGDCMLLEADEDHGYGTLAGGMSNSTDSQNMEQDKNNEMQAIQDQGNSLQCKSLSDATPQRMLFVIDRCSDSCESPECIDAKRRHSSSTDVVAMVTPSSPSNEVACTGTQNDKSQIPNKSGATCSSDADCGIREPSSNCENVSVDLDVLHIQSSKSNVSSTEKTEAFHIVDKNTLCETLGITHVTDARILCYSNELNAENTSCHLNTDNFAAVNKLLNESSHLDETGRSRSDILEVVHRLWESEQVARLCALQDLEASDLAHVAENEDCTAVIKTEAHCCTSACSFCVISLYCGDQSDTDTTDKMKERNLANQCKCPAGQCLSGSNRITETNISAVEKPDEGLLQIDTITRKPQLEKAPETTEDAVEDKMTSLMIKKSKEIDYTRDKCKYM